MRVVPETVGSKFITLVQPLEKLVSPPLFAITQAKRIFPLTREPGNGGVIVAPEA
jgi:hypothetical protein